ncbi:hypothetical protein GQ53DRAFT_767269 [Thozetella sp. PMI_491]|nr:hypothetical protein GQ53DRAFT_767269 [Thozetella sp. PMI_491]
MPVLLPGALGDVTIERGSPQRFLAKLDKGVKALSNHAARHSFQESKAVGRGTNAWGPDQWGGLPNQSLQPRCSYEVSTPSKEPALSNTGFLQANIQFPIQKGPPSNYARFTATTGAMTNQAHAQAHAGSSLFQARNTHDHRRLHSHQRAHDHQDRGRLLNHARSPDHEPLENRQATADPEPVVVVQTLSVIKIIDGSGALIGISTILDPVVAAATQAQPAAETVDLGLGVSLGVSLTVDLPTPTPTEGDSSPSGTTTSETVHVTNSSSSSSPSDEATLTSTPLTTTTSLSTSATQSNSTIFLATETAGVGAGATPTTDGASQTSAAGSSTGLPKETQNAVIGGVVGGIAGMALIVFLAMVILRWKRQQGNGLTLLRDRSSSVTGRALPPATGGGGGGDSAGSAMAERSGPFMIPAALATLTGHKRASRGGASGSSSGEKGFYRVSGKKLMPVIQSGGDGYSDPHDSLQTDVSFYRDSHSYFGGNGALQLGSPMRPESGIPVMRSGPGRTPSLEGAQEALRWLGHAACWIHGLTHHYLQDTRETQGIKGKEALGVDILVTPLGLGAGGF